MGIEIERKFLINSNAWRTGETGVAYRQGYLCTTAGCCVRVRTTGQQEAWLTVKGQVDTMTRLEYEYPIPMQDANDMLERLCGDQLVEKIRYKLYYADMLWEIDEFLGHNAGLIMAEVELTHRDQPIMLPAWVGDEVTADERYYNAYLAMHPYNTWHLLNAGIDIC